MTLAVAIAFLAAGCTSKGSPPSTIPSASKSTVAGPGPAWDAIFSQIQPDGTVGTQTALQAFSLAFGPMPGVTLPSGEAGVLPDGTGPLRWLQAHWNDITPDQQQAAVQLVPELALPGATPTGGTTPSPGAYLAAARLPLMAQNRTNAFYTQEAGTFAQQIGVKLGRTLGIPIDAHLGPQLKEGDAYAYVPVTFPFPKCTIVVTSLGDALDDIDIEAVLAHETFHCFQGAILTFSQFAYEADWIIEAEADWVSIDLVPSAPIDSDFWPAYLIRPGIPLFKRSYDAKGFYAQLADSGIDVWSKLIPVMQAPGNAAAFQASGANGDAFLNQWASGYFRTPARGTAWDITGPGITKYPAIPSTMDIAQGQTVPASATAYANTIYEVNTTSVDVLEFALSGHARIADRAGHDYLIRDNPAVCLKSGGCVCPNQGSNQAPPPIEPGNLALAVTGDPSGDSGTVTGVSLDQYCSINVTGTWSGNWHAGGFAGALTLQLVQTGQQVTGSITFQTYPCQGGKTRFFTLPVTGTLAGSAITLKATIGRSTLTGTVNGNSMSGTWGPTYCGPTATWNVTKTK